MTDGAEKSALPGDSDPSAGSVISGGRDQSGGGGKSRGGGKSGGGKKSASSGKERFATVRGTKDILPEEAARRHYLEGVARRVFDLYGYGELRTPIFERTELFARAVGATSDIVEKEMYTFADRNGDSLSLRPEGTASVVRSFIDNSLHRQLPWRVFYMGPMFRHERPQKGRYRQFHQIGCELFGPDGPLADVEMMAIVLRILREIGLDRSLTLEINSLGCPECRDPYRQELIVFFQEVREKLCPNCQNRLEQNPLRVLDCKRPSCRELVVDAPKMIDHLCGGCQDHFQGVLGHLERMGLSYQVNPLMVRGLDYYTRTAFEVITGDLGTQNAVAAGGRYDGLVGEMGGVATPAIGFAMGVERLALLLGEEARFQKPPGVYLVAVGEKARPQGILLAEAMRDEGIGVAFDLGDGSMKSQMKKAGRSGADFAVIIGEREVAEETAQVKNMGQGEQKCMAWGEVVSYLSTLLNRSEGMIHGSN
ncbi:MAG: histidine--tRNA ligase [Magnetococcales bacterium]|nr:histidine--tRNA ligase [Magnetococcales bacterium]